MKSFYFLFLFPLYYLFTLAVCNNDNVSPLRDRVRNDREAARVICGSERPQPNPKEPAAGSGILRERELWP